jgi:hypothetical protein
MFEKTSLVEVLYSEAMPRSIPNIGNIHFGGGFIQAFTHAHIADWTRMTYDGVLVNISQQEICFWTSSISSRLSAERRCNSKMRLTSLKLL